MATESASLLFGLFRLVPKERLLLEGDKRVRLGGRALDILIALAERAGDVVSKDQLIARAWPDMFVEEGNLKFQVRALRRALGDGQDGRRYIANVPGRGYSLVSPVSRAEAELPAPSAPVSTPPHNLPVQAVRLIGRANAIERLVRQVPSQRLTTIVGAGGIGKTSLALAVVEQLLPSFPHGVWLVELAPIADPALIPGALASLLGADASVEALIGALRDKHTLLVMDNCEHVIDAAANLVATLLAGARGLHVIATSREPLRVMGERVHRLGALPTPLGPERLDAKQALQFPAVELFVQCARTRIGDFELSDEDVRDVAEICRKLDGVPLALELGAAQVETFGVRELARQLDHGLPPRIPRRAAHPRHRALAATIEWSYQLLAKEEQAIFRRLAIFAGSFSLEAVRAVAASPEFEPSDVIEIVSNLVAKSLLVAEGDGGPVWFRLLETTRAYARGKLEECAEETKLARRHAEYYRTVLEHAEADLDARPLADWLAAYGRAIDNLRAALDWAFSPGGDPSIGVSLTAAAVALWMQMSLVEESRRRIEQAFEAVAAGVEVDARREMKLCAGLGASLIYSANGPKVAAVWRKALEIAESLGDAEYQMLSLWGLWAFHVNGAQYRTALTLARRFSCLASSRPNPNDRLTGERMMALAHHFLGDQPSARRHIERALPDSAASDGKREVIRLKLDPRVTGRVHLARVLWLQGFPDRAMRAVEQSIEDARTARHAISFNYALHRGACPVALWTGDSSAAGQYADMLLEHAKTHALGSWQLYGRGYQGAVAIRRGDMTAGLRLLKACFAELGETGITAPRFLRFAAVYMAEALGRAGQVSEGLVAIDDAIGRAERTDELWELLELMRVKGELLSLQSTFQGAASAENCFRHALEVARRQGALSWELRAATSLARLLRDQGRCAEAASILQPVHDRFTEGFDTADLKAAKSLLEGFPITGHGAGNSSGQWRDGHPGHCPMVTLP